MYGASSEHKELTGRDLLVEYERLIPINRAFWEGHRDRLGNAHYPKTLGRFNSREVREVFWCGDLCNENGSVNIIYFNVKQEDCAPIGEAVFSNYWGKEYQGCTPLVIRVGSLVETGFSTWSIAFHSDEDGTKLIRMPLRFDESSVCAKRRGRFPCEDIIEGQSAFVIGTKYADSLIVAKLGLEGRPEEP